MKKSKYMEEQIAFALRQAQTGARVEEICREFGISQATPVDTIRRECLAITLDRKLRDSDVVVSMEHINSMRGTPKRIQVGKGSEFIAKALDLWAYENGVTPDFSRL